MLVKIVGGEGKRETSIPSGGIVLVCINAGLEEVLLERGWLNIATWLLYVVRIRCGKEVEEGACLLLESRNLPGHGQLQRLCRS